MTTKEIARECAVDGTKRLSVVIDPEHDGNLFFDYYAVEMELQAIILAALETATQSVTERDQLRAELAQEIEWRNTLCLWGGTPEAVHNFIAGQQTRIHETQNIEAELAAAREDKERLLTCLEDCVLGWGLGRPDHWADEDVARWHKDYERAEQLCGVLRAAIHAVNTPVNHRKPL